MADLVEGRGTAEQGGTVDDPAFGHAVDESSRTGGGFGRLGEEARGDPPGAGHLRPHLQLTLRGKGIEVFEPRFTFHGFRYAEITGQPDGFDPAMGVRAVVLHSDLERAGSCECSDRMRGNFLDVPTDCPQCDERLGRNGDIQVFAPTASFPYDSAGLATTDAAARSLGRPDPAR